MMLIVPIYPSSQNWIPWGDSNVNQGKVSYCQIFSLHNNWIFLMNLVSNLDWMLRLFFLFAQMHHQQTLCRENEKQELNMWLMKLLAAITITKVQGTCLHL